MRGNLRQVCIRTTAAAALAVFFSFGFARADDLLTSDVKGTLNSQWASAAGSEAAIIALKTYGTGKNGKDALKILEEGQPDKVKELYNVAADSLGEEFWLLVAGAYNGSPSCDAVVLKIRAQYKSNKKSLADASKAYREKSPFTGLAVLLGDAPLDSPPTPPTRTAAQEIYRGCFAISPQALFKAVEEAVAIKH